jgi:hypothetical protein
LTIVHALGAKPRAQKADLIAQTHTLLAAEEHERRRRVVVIIDEAHLLAPDQLEELRLLTNAEMDSQSPFARVLVGQPTLARQLRLGVFAALDQRIATPYQLAPRTWPRPPNTSATTWPWGCGDTCATTACTRCGCACTVRRHPSHFWLLAPVSRISSASTIWNFTSIEGWSRSATAVALRDFTRTQVQGAARAVCDEMKLPLPEYDLIAAAASLTLAAQAKLMDVRSTDPALPALPESGDVDGEARTLARVAGYCADRRLMARINCRLDLTPTASEVRLLV